MSGKVKTLKIFKIRVIPLTDGGSSVGIPFDYTLRYERGVELQFPKQPEGAELKESLKNVAKTAMEAAGKANLLSYKYQEGDTCVFEVTFGRSKNREQFMFVTSRA